MASLLTTQTTDTTGTGQSHSGPCTVWVRGTLAGATVVIQGADANSAANFGKLDRSIIRQDVFRDKGCSTVTAYGTYFLRAILSGATASTSVTVETTQ